jgi:hypothetical protein
MRYRTRVNLAWLLIFFVPLVIVTLVIILIADQNAAVDECAGRGLVAVQTVNGGHVCVAEVQP